MENVGEEVEKPPSKEEKESSDKMEGDNKLTTREQEEIPKHGEEVPLLGVQEEEEKKE